jgi:RNA polymerase sigma-70 factor (ECF subfamily)
VSQYTDSVYGYVRHRLAPRADLVEDLVQDVFLAALASLASFRGTSSLRSWLLGIARHKVEDYYRERLREPESLGDAEYTEPVVDGPLVDETIDRERMEARTQQVLRQLPEPYSVALLWRYWESRSVREIAAATGKTEKSVERLLARARARFRELWEQR